LRLKTLPKLGGFSKLESKRWCPGLLLSGETEYYNTYGLAETPEELAMAAEKDPAIAEAAGLVMELNEDDAERMQSRRGI
jgi:hypothetical protein